MKHLFAGAIAACLALPAQAALIDAFFMNVQTPTGTDSTAVLSLGTNYKITVFGTFEIGCSGAAACPADAEFYTLGGTPYDRTGFSNTPGVGSEVGVGINGSDIDWGPFQPSRTYSTVFTGLGSTVNLFYQDTFYGDNVGSLRVNIETIGAPAIPLPASVPLLVAGLAALGVAGRRKRH